MATILIVDDDTALRDSLVETLADLGHVSVEAEDGTAALHILQNRRVYPTYARTRKPSGSMTRKLSVT